MFLNIFRRRSRRRPVVRPDESMQDHRHPVDLTAWSTYVLVMAALTGSAVTISAGLDMGWGVWALTLFGAAVIGVLISLAVLPSLRHR